MAQQIIVVLIVVAAALYVAWRYLPRRWRALLGVAQAPGCGGDDGGCSSCGSCGSASASPEGGEEKPVALPRSRR